MDALLKLLITYLANRALLFGHAITQICATTNCFITVFVVVCAVYIKIVKIQHPLLCHSRSTFDRLEN